MAITVPGAGGTPVTITGGSGDVLHLASQISALLGSIQTSNQLSVTSDTISGTMPSFGAGSTVLHGSSQDYRIANNGGSLSFSDDVSQRDGSHSVAGDTIQFTDGVGLFDPTGTAENVYRLYKGILGRTPSVDELKSWTAAIDNAHVPFADVVNDFLASPEFSLHFGSLSDDAFITQLYQNIFGRAPDGPGLNAWEAALHAGATRGDVAAAIVESQEGKDDTRSTSGDDHNGEVYRLYQAAFARAPETLGLSFWSSLLASGASVQEIAADIAASAEFHTDFGALSDADYVTALYTNALGRSPSPDEVNGWTSAMHGGLTRAEVLVGFSDSFEARQRFSTPTHANWVFLPSTPELLLNGPGGFDTTVPTGYKYIVVNDAASDTLSASNASIITNTVGGAFTISGNSTLAAAGGNNTVTATGDYKMSFGAGNNLVLAFGSGTVATGVGSSTVVASNTSGSGNVIDLTGANNLVDARFGNTTVNGGSDNSTITGGLNSLVASVSGANDLIVAGPGSTSVTLGASATSATIDGSGVPGATLAVRDVSLSDTINAFASGTTITAGAGGNGLIFDGGSSGQGNFFYAASVGSVTLNAAAATGNLSVSAGTLTGASIALGSGDDTLVAGAGADTLDGGSGNNVYSFVFGQTGGAADFVTDSLANIANDTFNFVGYAGAPTDSGIGQPVVLTLSDNTTITFTNVTDPASLHINNS